MTNAPREGPGERRAIAVHLACPDGTSDVQPEWAAWNRSEKRRYTIGVEEEVMLLHAHDHSLAQSSQAVLARLSDELSAQTSPETHACVIELVTEIRTDVASAVRELAALRARLASELEAMGLCAASAGVYPLAWSGETRVAGSGRYGLVAESMRSLARREPTLALHVHVGVPDAEEAIRVMNGLRQAVPLLLALSANSPFVQGSDSGLSSARTVIFQGFPRTGTARRFSSYADYVGAVDALIASGAIPDPSFLWWDVRLQPALGTVEVRVMDAQPQIADSAGLIALVQALAHLSREDQSTDDRLGPEVLAENRFLAARDGLDARLIDPVKRELVPARAQLATLLTRCREHADPVCSVELDRVSRLMHANGAERQRAWAREHGVPALTSMLTQRYTASNGMPGPAPRFVPPRDGAFIDPLRSGHSPSVERSERCVAGLPTRVLRSC